MLNARICKLFTLLSVCCVCAGYGFNALAGGTPSAEIKVSSVEMLTGKELVTLEFSSAARFKKSFLLHYPERVVVDVESVRNGGVALPSGYKGKAIRGMRFAQNNPETSRLVIDMNVPVQSVTVHEFSADNKSKMKMVVAIMLDGVVVDNTTTETKHIEKSVEKESAVQSASVTPNIPNYIPSVPARTSEPSAITIEEDSGKEKSNVALSKKNKGKPIIMVDAGHGGKDPGASSAQGEYEKHITLAYAKALVSALNKTGRYNAKLTRDSDVFILLGERVKLARKAGASMFISLHADSAPATQAEGLSIYTLSETASDKESAALAEQENNSDNIGGIDLGNQEAEVADILIDLARRETKNKSMEFAEKVLGGLKKQSVNFLRDPHRFAGFKVLKAPDIPSVLIELGFISTPAEAQRLKTAAHKERIIRGIVAGIDTYFRK